MLIINMHFHNPIDPVINWIEVSSWVTQDLV